MTRRSAKSTQGGPLPTPGSPLGDYPTGCCVRLGEHWHLIVFRIGREGGTHCRRMQVPPSDPTWNSGTGPAIEHPGSSIVVESSWPIRESDDRGSEEDPLNRDDDRERSSQRRLPFAQSS